MVKYSTYDRSGRCITMMKLWQESLKPGQWRTPIRIKKHSRFAGGITLTVLGTRWSRTWGILPKGTDINVAGCPNWLGGMSWRTKSKPGVLLRPTIALCKWRYR